MINLAIIGNGHVPEQEAFEGTDVKAAVPVDEVIPSALLRPIVNNSVGVAYIDKYDPVDLSFVLGYLAAKDEVTVHTGDSQILGLIDRFGQKSLFMNGNPEDSKISVHLANKANGNNNGFSQKDSRNGWDNSFRRQSLPEPPKATIMTSVQEEPAQKELQEETLTPSFPDEDTQDETKINGNGNEDDNVMAEETQETSEDDTSANTDEVEESRGVLDLSVEDIAELLKAESLPAKYARLVHEGLRRTQDPAKAGSSVRRRLSEAHADRTASEKIVAAVETWV